VDPERINTEDTESAEFTEENQRWFGHADCGMQEKMFLSKFSVSLNSQ
jgi:hypothetical protein